MMFAVALPLLALASAAPAQQPETSPAHQLINAKCTCCHSTARILKADPAQAPDIVDRMRQMNPEFFKDVDQAALKQSLSAILSDPQVAARRAAWDDTVAKGKALFADPALGTTGKSCATCHKPEGLRGVVERYPEFDARLGRLVDLQERLRMMIESKLGGKQVPLGDFRTIALEAYLKSLE